MEYGSIEKMAAFQAMDASRGCIEDMKVPSSLQRVTRRIDNFANGLRDLGSMLGSHADAVFGPNPDGPETAQGRPCRSGQFGDLEDAVDRLESALAFAAEQAGRNCALA